jgi:hypothetical protein
MDALISPKSGRGGARAGAGRKPLNRDPRITEGWYVYVMGEEPAHGFVKIGIANKPYKRLSSAQTSNPRALVFSALWALDASDVNAAVEKALHKALRPFHVRGEWFEVAVQDVERHLAVVADSFGVQARRVL